MKDSISIKNIILFTGSYCAYLMGASFSSGREMLQYFSGYGIKGFAGMAFTCAVFIYIGYVIMNTAARERFEDPFEVYIYFCGRKLGTVYVWLLTFLMVADMIMMTSSAGANLSENMGYSGYIGRCTCLLAAITVCLGLNRIIDVLSKLGPFVAIAMVVLAIIAIVKCPVTLSEADALIPQLDIYTGNSGIAESSIRYTMYCAITCFPILVVCGMKAESRKEIKATAVSQVAAWGTVCVLAMISQIVNIESIYNYEIPNMVLVKMYLPALHGVFSIIILICTYSATTLMLWTIVRKFAEEKTKKYYALTISIGIVAYLLSGTMPFSRILALVFNNGFYPGMLFLIMIIIKQIKERKIHEN